MATSPSSSSSSTASSPPPPPPMPPSHKTVPGILPALPVANAGVRGKDSEVSSIHNKGKSKERLSKIRRTWSRREEEVLLGALKEIIAEGWKLNNVFKAGYVQVLEGKLVVACPGTNLRAKPHIESKIKIWKRQYSHIVTMLNTNGFGWNDTEKMIEVMSEVAWENYCKRYPNASNMRDRSFMFYDDWSIIFGKDKPTGELAEGPTNAVEAINVEQDIGDGIGLHQHSLALDDMDFSASASQRGSIRAVEKRATKKFKRSDGITEVLTDFVDRFGQFLEKMDAHMEHFVQRIGYAHDLSKDRRLVNKELQRFPITPDERLDAVLAITKDAHKVDVFFSLSDEDRMRWVRKITHRG